MYLNCFAVCRLFKRNRSCAASVGPQWQLASHKPRHCSINFSVWWHLGWIHRMIASSCHRPSCHRSSSHRPSCHQSSSHRPSCHRSSSHRPSCHPLIGHLVISHPLIGHLVILSSAILSSSHRPSCHPLILSSAILSSSHQPSCHPLIGHQLSPVAWGTEQGDYPGAGLNGALRWCQNTVCLFQDVTLVNFSEIFSFSPDILAPTHWYTTNSSKQIWKCWAQIVPPNLFWRSNKCPCPWCLITLLRHWSSTIINHGSSHHQLSAFWTSAIMSSMLMSAVILSS